MQHENRIHVESRRPARPAARPRPILPIFLVLLAAALWTPALFAHHEATYGGLWHAEAPETLWRRADSRDDLAAVAQELAARGYGLTDVEVWLENRDRRYLGVFRRTKGVLGKVSNRQGFRRELDAHRGRRLVGFEVWSEGDKARYLGVWGSGRGSQRVELGLRLREFRRALRRYASTHHLADFETVRVNGRLEISGVWHPDPDPGRGFLHAATWDEFHRKVHEQADGGYRLADLEIHRVGEELYYSAYWRPGTPVDWLGMGYLPDWFEKADTNLGAGLGKSGVTNDDPPAEPGLELSRPPKLHLAVLEVYGFKESPAPGPGGLAAATGRAPRSTGGAPADAGPTGLTDGPTPVIPSHDGPKHDSGSAGPP